MADIIVPDHELVSLVARKLKIPLQGMVGGVGPWEPSEEQELFWKCVNASQFVICFKPRQIGITTAMGIFDVLFAYMNDAIGNRVRVALVFDKDRNITEKIRDMVDFCRQLEIPLESNNIHTIRFKNGSSIESWTSGGERAMAGQHFDLIHASELPGWRNPDATFTSMDPTLGLNGRMVIETTMNVRHQLPIDLWNTAKDGKNRYHPLWFDVEEHKQYRADPKTLEPEIEAWLRAEGYTKPETMAFIQEKYYNGGNKRTKEDILREYPKSDKQCFKVLSGRYIQKTPQVLEHDLVPDVPHFQIFRKRDKCSPNLIIGVDTSEGVGQDNTCIVVMDRADHQIVAAWTDNRTDVDAASKLVESIQKYYRQEGVAGLDGKMLTPRKVPVVIEKDGPGANMLDRCANRRKLPFVEPIKTTPQSRYDGLLFVKNAIEEGKLFGPERLKDEAEKLQVEQKPGKTIQFYGIKDMCMSLGFAFCWDLKYPLSVPQTKNVVDIQSLLAKRRNKKN